MKKTALQQAIGQLIEKSNSLGYSTKESRARKGVYVDAIIICKSLLPTEKEQIETAFDEGVEDGSETRFPSSGKEYFTNTYGE